VSDVEKRSMFGHRTQQPITIVIGEQMLQVAPAKARELALLLLEGADAAESDAFISLWFRDRCDIEPGQRARILQDFREYRARLRAPAEQGNDGDLPLQR
jgi:hypothetical protein